MKIASVQSQLTGGDPVVIAVFYGVENRAVPKSIHSLDGRQSLACQRSVFVSRQTAWRDNFV
ncbi:MAG TPA: hypothetical protein VKR81_01210 [Candidatus Binatia bacterium]|nr:hypothetical protein [Candidatus Binatia bacterium]